MHSLLWRSGSQVSADLQLYVTTNKLQADFAIYKTDDLAEAGQPCAFCP